MRSAQPRPAAAQQQPRRILLLILGLFVAAWVPGPKAVAAAGDASVAAGTAVLSSSLALKLDGLTQLRLPDDFALDFSAADAAARAADAAAPITLRGQPLQALHKQGYYYGNVAVMRFGSDVILAVRKIQFYLTLREQLPDYPPPADPARKWVSWWQSKISVCRGDPATLQPLSCTDYEPRNWTDCLWNGGFESLGPEDPRLITWPGKGLFMMFISKPASVNPSGSSPADTKCAGDWDQQPWLVPLITYSHGQAAGVAQTPAPGASAADPWVSSGVIRLQYIPKPADPLAEDESAADAAEEADTAASQPQAHTHAHSRGKAHGAAASASGKPKLRKEKNWNPFFFKNELYLSHSLDPHVVLKAAPDGRCEVLHESSSDALRSLPGRPKGNTQAVHLPAMLAGGDVDFYLGILHVEVNRTYTSYFYKMEGLPPFGIMAVSAPIPLLPGTHPRVPTWKHIAFPLSLQLLEESLQLLIGYGSGDQTARVRVMSVADALALFDSRDRPQPHDMVGG